MAGADIGGDDSVQWTVRVGHVRVEKLKQEPEGPKGWLHEGVDETARGEMFTVSIKIPQRAAQAAQFAESLAKAAAKAARMARGGGRVTFELPIEQRNPTQIRVRWNSKPVRPRQ